MPFYATLTVSLLAVNFDNLRIRLIDKEPLLLFIREKLCSHEFVTGIGSPIQIQGN